MKSTTLLSAFCFLFIMADVKSGNATPSLPAEKITMDTPYSRLPESQSFCEDIAKITDMLKGDFTQLKGGYDEDIEGYMASVEILSSPGYYIELDEYNSKSVVWNPEGVSYSSLLAQLKTCDLKDWTVISTPGKFTLSDGPDPAEYMLADAKEIANTGTGTTITLYNSWNKYSNKTEVTIQVNRTN